MANLARSVHSSNDHFQRKNGKFEEERGKGRKRRKGAKEGINHTFSSSNLELYLF